MTDNKIIHTLIEEELAEANKIHPLFQSPHEAYAVILEELEEAEEELQWIRRQLGQMWSLIRQDCGTEEILHQIKGHAVFAAQEIIQLAAMADKTLDSLYKE